MRRRNHNEFDIANLTCLLYPQFLFRCYPKAFLKVKRIPKCLKFWSDHFISFMLLTPPWYTRHPIYFRLVALKTLDLDHHYFSPKVSQWVIRKIKCTRYTYWKYFTYEGVMFRVSTIHEIICVKFHLNCILSTKRICSLWR